MAFYRRRLPHWQPSDKSFFITWRLHGSLPRKVGLPRNRAASPAGRASDEATKDASHYPDAAFLTFDQHLDSAAYGPTWLREPRLAQMVVDALMHGEQTMSLYSLWTYVVMPNHVHVLITPRAAVEKVTRAIKGYTAREANRLLGQTGQKFWQTESFDHWVRNEGSFDRLVRYIENNPVQARLAARPQDWPWSSAAK